MGRVLKVIRESFSICVAILLLMAVSYNAGSFGIPYLFWLVFLSVSVIVYLKNFWEI